ncbi:MULTISPECIES: competence type IV pilus ATPase ComGA [Aerococcus]|uniref:competence type IV pilus ATPase ComGA n=1 Tax=Aerococcus TaxID=1375 RepID=UPI000DCBB784|nr:competence type IV pilus ATPase ComGA [Aerococcus urinae]MDK7302936.1 competence type IV pilus ATPase ComGA [Aerococcus urinae]RAV71505.1 general secretion pathway protein GspE [Aerococcus urinae]RAW05138.1 general secretion pathway protein GspE [Aerococcus urinae]
MQEITQEILSQAYQARVDDIHLLPERGIYQVYFRQEGILKPVRQFDLDFGSRWIRYLKYISHLDVGEQRLPQEGALIYQLDQGEIELRLSTLANYLMQESLVIRLLYDQSQWLYSEREAEDLEEMKKYLYRKSGLMLFSGPVASGKTSTIYHLLREVYQERACQVITMEDPVEIKEANFLQISVNRKAGLTYERLIKASLRHHPDILLIGEIRDEETAQMVMRAALTGHLVIATIHAKNCIGVIGRLKELGLSQEQLLQTLLFVASQRLIPVTGEAASRQLFCEWMNARMLAHYLTKGEVTSDFKSLNSKLQEAYTHGKIQAELLAAYQLEENC